MINRRRFIQASALLIAGTSTLALTGCGSSKTPEDVACAFVRALYRVKVAFGNGSSKVETAQLIKTEKGWLVTFGL